MRDSLSLGRLILTTGLTFQLLFTRPATAQTQTPTVPGNSPNSPSLNDQSSPEPTPTISGQQNLMDQIERQLREREKSEAAAGAEMPPSQPRTIEFTGQPIYRVLQILAGQAQINYVEPNISSEENVSLTLNNVTPLQAFYRIARARGFEVINDNDTYTLRRSDIPAPSFYVTRRYIIKNTPAEFLLQPVANLLGAKVVPAGNSFPGYPKPSNTPEQSTNALQSLNAGTGADQSRPRYIPGIPFDAPSSTGSYTANEEDAVFVERGRNALVVRTTIEKQEQVAREIASLDYREQQILIKTYVIEVDANKSTGGGVDWSQALGLNPGQGTTFTLSGSTPSIAGSPIVGQILGQGNFFTNGLVVDVSNIPVTLRALQSKGKIRNNSSPMTIAKSGMPVTIRSSTDQTVFLTTPGSQQYGQSTQPYTFTTGLTIDIVARILQGGLVDLNLNPTLSTQSGTSSSGLQTNVDVPIIATRSATANVTVRSGQAAIIGGILQDQYQVTKSMIPGLGRVPVLGLLFKARAYMQSRTNLIIIVSPTIISADNRRLDRFGRNEQKTVEKMSNLPGEPPPVFSPSDEKQVPYPSSEKELRRRSRD